MAMSGYNIDVAGCCGQGGERGGRRQSGGSCLEPALASAYIGAAFALFPVTQVVIQPGVYPLIGLVFLPLYFLTAIIGILGNFWMPRLFQPKWIREERSREKQEQRIRKAKQTEMNRLAGSGSGSAGAYGESDI